MQSEGFDEYLKEAGLSLVPRKLATSIKTSIQLAKEGDEYQLITYSTFKTRVLKFKLGEEYDEETMDGRSVKSVITIEGNKMISTQNGEKPTIVTREFTEDDCLMTITYGDTVAKRWYKVVH